MGLSLITPAATLPVSLAAVKVYCGVEDDSFDALLDQLRKSAVRAVEEVMGRSIGEQTWQLTLDQFSDAIELERGPVLELVAGSFKYYNPAGALVAVPDETYSLDLVSDPAWIVRNDGASWPQTISGVNAVELQFTAGWTEALLPEPIREAVCMICAARFEDRTAKMPPAALELIQPWRTMWVTA